MRRCFRVPPRCAWWWCRRAKSTGAACIAPICYALERALRGLDPAPDICLTDGFRLPVDDFAHTAVVRGDATSAAIAAASIVAKVTRDTFMHRMAKSFPEYGFESHVGYITP